MRVFDGIVMVMVLAVLSAGDAFAVSVQRLSAMEQANTRATHRVVIKESDLTETSTNTAQTLGASFPVAAKMGVEVVAMQLVTSFDEGTTNYTGSCALTVGDGTDADLYLTSTELHADGTEVWLKYGRSTWLTAATTTGNFLTNCVATTGTFGTNVSVTTSNLVYLNASTNAATQTVVIAVSQQTASAVTAVTTSGTAAVTAQTQTQSSGQKVYTSADYVDFTFTPNAQEALSALTQGEVWIYIRIWDSRVLTP